MAHGAWEGDVIPQGRQPKTQAQGNAKVGVRERDGQRVQPEPSPRLLGAAGLQTDAVGDGAVGARKEGIKLDGGQAPGEHVLQGREGAPAHVEGGDATWVKRQVL